MNLTPLATADCERHTCGQVVRSLAGVDVGLAVHDMHHLGVGEQCAAGGQCAHALDRGQKRYR